MELAKNVLPAIVGNKEGDKKQEMDLKQSSETAMDIGMGLDVKEGDAISEEPEVISDNFSKKLSEVEAKALKEEEIRHFEARMRERIRQVHGSLPNQVATAVLEKFDQGQEMVGHVKNQVFSLLPDVNPVVNTVIFTANAGLELAQSGQQKVKFGAEKGKELFFSAVATGSDIANNVGDKAKAAYTSCRHGAHTVVSSLESGALTVADTMRTLKTQLQDKQIP